MYILEKREREIISSLKKEMKLAINYKIFIN